MAGFVLDEDELESISEDLHKTIKPSWVTSVPGTLTSTGGPKLKADQWRVIGSLYLPIAFGRLWYRTEHNTHQILPRSRLLHLSMLLFSAIRVASSRITSDQHAEQYLNYMLSYRAELKSLFPNYDCHVNHHMAIHISDCLRMYGPVHGWWCYPFERMFGMLQRIPTNYKPGLLKR